MRQHLSPVALAAILSVSAIGCVVNAAEDESADAGSTEASVDSAVVVPGLDAGAPDVAVDDTRAPGTKDATPPKPDAPAASDKGISFGPSGIWAGTATIEPIGTSSFTGGMDSASASTLVDRIAAARKNGVRLMMSMTGGAHDNYLTGGVFDLSKWKAKMDTYDTPALKAAVAAAVADGIIVGNSVMDEPNVSGGGDGNTWGPPGTMTKVRVDGLCSYVKAIFPTMPVGVAQNHSAFEPDKSYKVCDFIISQYSDRFGDVTAFRDAGLAMAKRDGHAIAFSINILNGGIQAKRDGAWSCPLTTTGGRGTYEPNCRMTAEQVVSYGEVLGPAGCMFNMWRYDEAFMSKPDNQKAFAQIATLLAKSKATECRRP